ncbi:MAG TPA: type II toxin-antitoxin system VapC family toxin [Candidatus Binatia bacterium]|nr:type II toxin-antitoxin system VapC family toxin [Candidatus Binatia bacterium]
MNLLLDTHVWLWSHAAPERLNRKVTALLTDAKSILWLSPVSIWEFLLLAQRGRIHVPKGSEQEWVDAALARAPMQDAPLNREVARRSRSIGLAHDDPADRFLAATADVYDLTLVTADERLLRGKGYKTIGNR